MQKPNKFRAYRKNGFWILSVYYQDSIEVIKCVTDEQLLDEIHERFVNYTSKVIDGIVSKTRNDMTLLNSLFKREEV